MVLLLLYFVAPMHMQMNAIPSAPPTTIPPRKTAIVIISIPSTSLFSEETEAAVAVTIIYRQFAVTAGIPELTAVCIIIKFLLCPDKPNSGGIIRVFAHTADAFIIVYNQMSYVTIRHPALLPDNNPGNTAG